MKYFLIIYKISNYGECYARLRVKPKYEDLIGVAFSDGLGNIEFPNRDAEFLRDGFVLSQLDGEGMRIRENSKIWQAKNHIKNIF